ncbi:MAG: N-6 DNA methylase [Prevotella sp.]|nr:N-6 DNA methylase [Prevotella sp.]
MLFQKNIVKKYLAALPKEETDGAWDKYRRYFMDREIQANILQSKEEQFQEGFLRELFVKILGYTLNPSPGYNLITEQKNATNAKKADGAIIVEGKVIGVIELKDHKTTDLSKVEAQAFGYKNQHVGTRLVITSNFEKLRLYIDNAVAYREWSLFYMTEDDFKELYLCLAWQEVRKGTALRMMGESVSKEDQITNALYRDYSQFKRLLFADILANNPYGEDNPWASDIKDWQLLLFKKTQKLLDRLLFIFFAEDGGLLPTNMIAHIIERWQLLKDNDEYRPLYDILKKHFNYLNEGYQGKKYEIFAYNGGLFKPDEVLDALTISDPLLVEHTRRLSAYDFESDVDVNILGHIFEHSLSEIEEVKAKALASTTPFVPSVAVPPQQTEAPVVSKRKQDGVFYTPQYITKYIVTHTVGRLCQEKKHELGIDEEQYFADQKRQTATKRRLLDQLRQYREWLLQVTILDPACGSGAFLNAALSFLIAEHRLIDEMEAKVAGSSLIFQDVEKSILENNLYGVDINEESVEIAQLALWLRTAKPHRKLNSLNQNIKCGNSLISDPAVAGDKAFDWQHEFPKVFAKGGFDVVIGNPPYVNINTQPHNHEYFKSHYSEIHTGYNDLMYYFIYQGVGLLNHHGLLGFITSNYYIGNEYAKKLRIFLGNYAERIINFHNAMIFEDANVHTAILFAKKKELKEPIEIYNKKNDLSINGIDLLSDFNSCRLERNTLQDSWLIADTTSSIIIDKMKGVSIRMEDIAIIEKGSTSGKNDVFTVSDEFARVNNFETDIIRKNVKNGDIQPYFINNRGNVLIYTDNATEIEKYPNVYQYLLSHKQVLSERNEVIKGSYKWYRLERPRNKVVFDAKEKLIVPYRAEHNRFAFDDNQYFNDGGDIRAIIIKDNSDISIKYLLSLLNSKLLDWFYGFIGKAKGNAREYFNKPLAEVPIPNIDIESQQPFVSLADTMISLNKELQEKRNRFLRRLVDNVEGVKITGSLQKFDQMTFGSFVSELRKQKVKLSLSQQDEWEDYFNQNAQACQDLSRQIAYTDKEIDLRVYRLYGLTYDEVVIVDPQTPITRDEYMREQ